MSRDPAAALMNGLTSVLQGMIIQALADPMLPDGQTPNPRYRPMSASEMEVVRKLLSDNSVTLASVQRGDFGEAARKLVEENLPFPGSAEDGGPTFN